MGPGASKSCQVRPCQWHHAGGVACGHNSIPPLFLALTTLSPPPNPHQANLADVIDVFGEWRQRAGAHQLELLLLALLDRCASDTARVVYGRVRVRGMCSGSVTRLRARAAGHGQTRPQAQPYHRAGRQPREG
jgi:hypothetical protein